MTTLTRGNGQPKPAGTWDWYGPLDPLHARPTRLTSFSIGVFRWLPTSEPGVTQQGRVVKRFFGETTHPERVYAQAREYIQDLEARSLKPVPDRLDAARSLIITWRTAATQEPADSPAHATYLACALQLEQTLS